MMKFWKSAAKGKTGCPVRPPETVATRETQSYFYHLDSEVDDNTDFSWIFKKKSRLSITLHDILKEKMVLDHYVNYMDTVGKHTLIKCWLDIENFRKNIPNTTDTDLIGNHSKLSKAKSFDHQLKCNSLKSHRFSWREDKTQSLLNEDRLKSQCSTSSCGNLTELKSSIPETDEVSRCYLTEEAICLFKKYVALEAPHPLDLPDKLRKSVISNICQPGGCIKEDCFKPVQDIIYNLIESHYFNDFINSPFYIRAQIEILTKGSLNLIDILHDESILFYFTEYLEQEKCSILLEFVMAIMHFRDNLLNGNTVDPDQAQADAIILYEKYFSLQASNPIGFTTEVRLEIESNICREGGPLPSCFDLPYKIVFKTLSKYVKTFLESDLYYKYLSEMVHSVDEMWSSNHKSQSDCSSEFSISTQNTLLAMGDPVFRKKKRNNSVPDMTIDSNQLYNADALWQRKKNDGLSLGRVNSLGRFESKFEPDPDKKENSVLKKVVRRFVPTNTSRVDEEMAWQIAHMIVKDVTDLTMAPPDNEND